jgi:tetratricopeptide (TPR) repeat protein
MLWVLGPMTLLSGLLIPWFGIIAILMFAACVAAWLVFGLYSVIYGVGAQKAADAIGRVLMPSGASTPSVNQHSNIETLAIRGQYAQAAEAYQAAIAADPADIVACEKLGQMAMRDMKDWQLAVFAYREAEKRAASEKSKVAFGTIVAELYRDKLGEPRRAVVELSRLIATYPDHPSVPHLREELDLIKAHLFDEAR